LRGAIRIQQTERMNIKPLNLILLLVAIGIFTYAFFFFDNEKPLRKLPIYGNKATTGTDTVYHTIPAFNFTDQHGNSVTEALYADKIYVADFFFTTCGSICPIMTTEMARVAKEFASNDKVLFLSHTVDPETDSVAQLYAHAQEKGVNYAQWKMVTGDKKALYDIARQGYLLDAHQGDGGPDDFIHTQNFALIDSHKRIRGFYDGTDTTEMNSLIKDMNLLLAEEKVAD
jgi:protein SCO1